MITLLQLRKCPWAAAVRQTLANVGQDYGVIQVPYDRALRHQVVALTGQDKTPVLIDGDTVLWDSRRIVAYLYETYGMRASTNAPRKSRRNTARCRPRLRSETNADD